MNTSTAMTAERAAAADVLATIRGGGWFDATKDEALRLAIAALTAPAGVPNGFVVVPREPTEAMLRAVGEFHGVGHIYAAMIAAAAPPSDAPGEGKGECTFGHFGDTIRPLPAIPSPAEQGARERMMQAFPTLADFYDKHALGPKLPPSCLCCGHSMAGRETAIQHAELPGIVICRQCRDATLAPLAAGRVGVQTWRETIGGMKPGPALFEGQQLYVRIEDLERCDTEWAENYAALANERESLAGPLVAGEAWLLLAYAGNEPSVAYHCRTRADVERAYRDAVFGGDITGNETEATEFMQTFDDADEWAGSRLTINYEDGGVSIFRITGPLVYADTAKAGES
jgi:hypothetical protein